MDCRLVGRWRIVEADLWIATHLDLVVPATMTIGADGHGEIAYGAMQASLELQYSRSMVFFTWAGFDEMDQVSGTGSAELNDDGTIEVAFAYRLGDEAILKAEWMTSSTACDAHCIPRETPYTVMTEKERYRYNNAIGEFSEESMCPHRTSFMIEGP